MLSLPSHEPSEKSLNLSGPEGPRCTMGPVPTPAYCAEYLGPHAQPSARGGPSATLSVPRGASVLEIHEQLWTEMASTYVFLRLLDLTGHYKRSF